MQAKQNACVQESMSEAHEMRSRHMAHAGAASARGVVSTLQGEGASFSERSDTSDTSDTSDKSEEVCSRSVTATKKRDRLRAARLQGGKVAAPSTDKEAKKRDRAVNCSGEKTAVDFFSVGSRSVS